jgi:hypothetical protein
MLDIQENKLLFYFIIPTIFLENQSLLGFQEYRQYCES